MCVLAPVPARTRLAAREWLRLVSKIFTAPIRTISARHASVGCTGSMQRFPSARRTRWPLKAYPWVSENHAQLKTSATISSIAQPPFQDGSNVCGRYVTACARVQIGSGIVGPAGFASLERGEAHRQDFGHR